MLVKARRLIAPVIILAIAASGCGGGGSATPKEIPTVAPASLSSGATVPAPTGPVVLTISGDISNPNVGDTLQLDMPTLERLGLVEYSVDDQQAEGRVVTFRGPTLRSILDVAGVGPKATTLSARALNDYSVDIPISDANAYPVMVATTVDGARMPVEKYGPIRVVYPYGLYDIDHNAHDPLWIWQLASIDVS